MNEHSRLLSGSLGRVGKVISVPSQEHWAIRTTEMKRVAAVDLSKDWLSISLALRRLSQPISLNIIRSMLRRNAGVAGCPRIVGQNQKRRQVVFDVPSDSLAWDSDSELDQFITSMLQSLYAIADPKVVQSEPRSQEILPREQLAAVFEEAGWPAQADAERLEIPLEMRGMFITAAVRQHHWGTEIKVPLLAHEISAASKVCRNAVIVLLWLTASRIRMVKATQLRGTLALDISLLPEQCNAIVVGHACAALSFALQSFIAEASLLVGDEELAATYLSCLGFPTST